MQSNGLWGITDWQRLKNFNRLEVCSVLEDIVGILSFLIAAIVTPMHV